MIRDVMVVSRRARMQMALLVAALGSYDETSFAQVLQPISLLQQRMQSSAFSLSKQFALSKFSHKSGKSSAQPARYVTTPSLVSL